jgi:hypothetical protein
VTTVRSALELGVLRALCTCTELARTRAAVARLAGYDWSEPDLAVVFSAIRSAAERGAEVTRETVLMMATRAGFPELDLGTYFEPREVSSVEAAVGALLGERRR